MHGEPITLAGSDLLARCVQHETDHLDGIVFIDRLDAQTRKEAMKANSRVGLVRCGSPADQDQPPSAALPMGCDTVRVVFAGTPDVAVASLVALEESSHEVVGVLTRPDAPAGRGRRLRASPVKMHAKEAGIEVRTPSNLHREADSAR